MTGIAVLLMSVAGLSLAQEEEPAAEEILAQNEDLTLPPVIEETPGDVRFEPPSEHDESLEVVVEAGQTDWRLPDLGTSLRDEEEERELDQRMEFEALPYYDPEKQVEMLEPTPIVDVLRDVGFLKIFNIEFGRRTPE
jgi:hypothetical protein